MSSYEPLPYRAEHRALGLAQFSEAKDAPREHERMLANEVFDLSLRGIVQCIIGSAHISEFGVSATVNNNAPRQQGILRWNRAIGTIRVP